MEKKITKLRTKLGICETKNLKIGDPSYWGEYSGAKLNKLVLDSSALDGWTGMIELSEMNHFVDFGEFGIADYNSVHAFIAFSADESKLPVYLSGSYFENQKLKSMPIMVDTAKILIESELGSSTFDTGCDGQWGVISKFVEGKRVVGMTIAISFSRNYTFDEVQQVMTQVLGVTNWRESE